MKIPQAIEIMYLKPKLREIIEAVVTNNLGFDPDKDRPFKEGYSTFHYIDCRGLPYEEAIKTDPNNTDLPEITTKDPEIQNLHWHLSRLNYSKVISPYGERERKLPLFLPLTVTHISMPERQDATLN